MSYNDKIEGVFRDSGLRQATFCRACRMHEGTFCRIRKGGFRMSQAFFEKCMSHYDTWVSGGRVGEVIPRKMGESYTKEVFRYFTLAGVSRKEFSMVTRMMRGLLSQDYSGPWRVSRRRFIRMVSDWECYCNVRGKEKPSRTLFELGDA